MACCFPFKSSSAKFKGIRVVNLNGQVQHLDYPVAVSQLTHELPKHFVSTTAKLISNSKPLSPETQLEPGHIYMILPYSIFQMGVSKTDLISLSHKLTSIAKRSRPDSKVTSSNSVLIQKSTPNHVLDSGKGMEQQDPSTEASTVQKYSSKNRSWNPVLTTIIEKSFNKRSESDPSSSLQIDSPALT